ncbi:hypothetical protein [Cytobacillus kochii]|uniref:Uncharacterized protein n=1 Tax=Cytobacillus kochii TaxID=859143 RepID=A0A248TFU0_9BACI|nr:hypothetical protein [Cytobacillus kochii]ASV67045.1 hypothetical protein CKF48_06705 [Cytobacillus kochii]
MNLQFEQWIQSQNLPEEAISIIEEGINCYKIGAYRASFLMSYYFFLKILKHRLEQARDAKPDSISLKTWQDLLNKIQDDSVWDQTVFDTTRWKENDGRSKIYLISNDLREDMVYWRRKRNDCAHSKDNIISYPHVESFWLFIQSNLSKFIVNGGREGLLNKVEKHFDPKFTQPGQDYSYIIEQIPLVVKISEISNLLNDIHEILEKQSSYMYIENKKGVYYFFWKDIAFSINKEINDGFIEFITSNHEIFIEFITVYPEKLLMCSKKEELMRLFWREFFFKRGVLGCDEFWNLAIILLNNKIIPTEERDTFVRKLALKGVKRDLNDEQIKSLKTYGLFKHIREYLFVDDKLTQLHNGYHNANKNSSFIIFYLKNEPLDDIVVSRLNSLLYGLRFGQFFELFSDFLKNNPTFIIPFSESVERQGFNLAPIFEEDKEEHEV